ncbi:MAG: HAD family hydrolase [Ruminococcaceae bacterium]|nr:HAD family hydrolase [Oscillospiraceae bacterium]MBQ2780839.1 HAD family hydrolase [Clostridia bacterium]
MTKLCIFDLDGTVLDTVQTLAHYGNGALVNHGVAPIEAEQYKYLAGAGMAALIKNMLNFRECYTDELFKKVLSDYDTAYNADITYKTTIYEGLVEALDNIKAQGIELAIVSNKPDYAAKDVVYALFGKDYFREVVGQLPDVPLKPDPTAVFGVMERAGVAADECLYIGDTSTDMKTGKNAGLFSVGVLWGFRGEDELRDNGADLIIRHPSELYHYILSNG